MNTHDLKIPDLESGIAFLTDLPLANPLVAEHQLLQFLDALLSKPLTAGSLFALLEASRLPVAQVEQQIIQRYHNSALPLTLEEEGAFQAVVSIWRRMEQAYALCLRLSLQGKTEHHLIATLLQRCLYYSGMVIFEHYRARRELPNGVWLSLHAYYALAEEKGLSNTPVEDRLESASADTHCTATYVTLLLLDIGSAYSHSVSDLDLMRHWAAAWSPLVSLVTLDDDEEVPPYFVELRKDAPLHQMGNAEGPGEDARALDTTHLEEHINQQLMQWQQQLVAKTGGAETADCHALPLLSRLSRPWTQSASPRKFRRFAATTAGARVTSGFEAMYFSVAQQQFEQPTAFPGLATDDLDFNAIFKAPGDELPTLSVQEAREISFDDWSVINHSANGFRLTRGRAGQRIAHAQLLTLMPHDGEYFLLARTRWLMQAGDGGLVAGVAVLPGIPQAVAMRETGSERGFVPAFLLPSVPAMKTDGSLVIPLGLFMARRLVDVVVNGENRQLRLRAVLETGLDYERVSYEAV